MQELLATEDVGAYGLTSNTLLQRATLAEFSYVVGLLELNCFAVLVAAVGRGGGPSRVAHSSDFRGVNFIKISAHLESQLEIVSEGLCSLESLPSKTSTLSKF